MHTLLKRPLHVLSNRLRRKLRPAERMKEKWTADFSKPEKSCFDIKPEFSHNAYLDSGSLFLGLKKKSCMAWLETADRVYVDQLIEARLRFDGLGGYCAAGIMFRVVDGGTYYLALFSSKGYFRVDAVTRNVPSPLVGWTEAPGLDGSDVGLGIIARGDHLVFLLNGRWIAEARDGSIPGGHLGLALVSYNDAVDAIADAAGELQFPAAQETYTCKAWLDYLSVDSRPAAVDGEYNRWCGNAEISAESRLRLAESYAALGRCDSAYDQILKAWQQREESARSVMATYTEMRTRGELLFAARMAVRMGRYETAREYVDDCLAMDDDASYDGSDALDALSQKAIILNSQEKYAELAGFLPDCIQRANAGGDSTRLSALYALLGHAYWNLQDYKASAATWEKAFGLNARGGLYAAKAADAFEMLGKHTQALHLRIDAGNCFLQEQDLTELGALVPKLLATGKKSWEAHALAGKWALASGDFDYADVELALSEELRHAEQVQHAVQPQQEAGPTDLEKKPVVKARKAPAKKPVGNAVDKKPARKPANNTADKKPAPKAKPKPSAPAGKKPTTKASAPAKKAPAKKSRGKTP